MLLLLELLRMLLFVQTALKAARTRDSIIFLTVSNHLGGRCIKGRRVTSYHHVSVR